MKDLNHVIIMIFDYLKSTEIRSGTGSSRQIAVSVVTLKNFLRGLKLFPMRDVDVLCSQLGVPQVRDEILRFIHRLILTKYIL